uniref:Uncharacterized protein n=1 Tax=Salmo trutta TaxID=8032 RepID=A0A674EQ89_SALTR
MKAMFSLFLLIQSVRGWMHPKCHVYNSEQYTAACRDVTAIEEDLLGLPSNIDTLCISMKHGENRSISLGFFARFQYLEYLYIGGCFPQILPAGNSQGLPNLQHMYFNGLVTGCCDGHIGPNTFRDLVKLSHLTKFGYSVFIHEPCVEDLSEILCRIIHIMSLTKLNVQAPYIQSLNQSNCSILNATECNLTSADLDFGQINHIEEGALACLKNLTSFSGCFCFQSRKYILPMSIQAASPCPVLSCALGWNIWTENSLDLCSFRIQPITWLKQLTFMSSNVQTLFAKQFSCLENLQSLDLSCSFISDIEDFAFFGLANLESLNITQNNITQLYANTFIGLHSLTLLDLREDPQIYNIEAMSFAQLTCLRQVFLG